jgi:hypothetical protein
LGCVGGDCPGKFVGQSHGDDALGAYLEGNCGRRPALAKGNKMGTESAALFAHALVVGRRPRKLRARVSGNHAMYPLVFQAASLLRTRKSAGHPQIRTRTFSGQRRCIGRDVPHSFTVVEEGLRNDERTSPSIF